MAVSAPVRRVIFTANESKKGVAQGREGIKNIGQVILKRTKVKREAFAQTNLFRKRREESEKRMMLEDELEAPRVAAIPTGAQQLVEKTGAKGFFNRILGFLGYLAAGWLMNNLPTWIAMGKEFIARIQKAGEIVSGFFNNTIKLFTGVGSLLSSLGQNLLQFDFFDTSNRVKNSMSELNSTMGSLTGQIEEAFSLLTTPLTEGKYSGEEIPETGTQQTDQGAYQEPPPYSGSAPSSGGTKYPELASLVVKGEGGINSVNRGNAGDTPGGAKSIFGKNLTDMTVGEIMQAQRQGRVVAVGKYQFIPSTLSGAVKYTKIPLNAKFNSATQNRLFDYLIDVKRPEIGAYINGKSNDRRTAVQQLAREFASVGLEYPEAGRVRGQSRYAGIGRNKASISPEAAASVLDKQRRGGPAQLQPSKQESQIQQVPVGNVNPTIGDRLGAGRGHKGVDLQVKMGTPLRAISDGVIVDSDFEKGWGNFLVMKDDRGIYHLYGHMQSGYKRGGPVKKGEVIGKVGMTGRTSGPHLHWEAGTGWNGGQVTGRFDALSRYSKFAPFNTQPGPGVVSATPAQIAAAPQQSQTVPSALTPERRGQDIIIVDQPRQQQNIITPAASGGGAAPSPISDFDLLNNFIKNKLLLDLAYL
jgi:murein DD-endopeptidase MepM/ murein hydrolase activator NlpD